jgi:hypothetical protein
MSVLSAVPRDAWMMVAVMAIVLAVCVVLAVMLCSLPRTRPTWAQHQKMAWRTFRSIGVGPADPTTPTLGLLGETATVLQREVAPPEHRFDDPPMGPLTVDLHLHVRNHDGRAFFVIARSDNTSFIRPIGEGALKAILKDRYQAPARLVT